MKYGKITWKSSYRIQRSQGLGPGLALAASEENEEDDEDDEDDEDEEDEEDEEDGIGNYRVIFFTGTPLKVQKKLIEARLGVSRTF